MSERYPETMSAHEQAAEPAPDDAVTGADDGATPNPAEAGHEVEPADRVGAAYILGRLLLLPTTRVLFRPRIEGRENVPLTGPVILASNHLSFIDSIAIPVASPRVVRFLAKSDYFDGPGLKGRLSSTFFTAVGARPVRRGAGQAALEALEQQKAFLDDGQAVALYPEGTRSRDGRLYKGRTGVAFLALQTGAPVVPVGLIGTNKVMPIGATVPRLRPRITIRFGEPLDLSRHGAPTSGRARRAATEELMAAIHALSGQELANAYNEPPAENPIERLKQALPLERRGTGEPS